MRTHLNKYVTLIGDTTALPGREATSLAAKVPQRRPATLDGCKNSNMLFKELLFTAHMDRLTLF